MRPSADLLGEIRSALHRARFYADIPAILRILRYRRIRETWYREYWHETAQAIGAKAEDFGPFIRITRDGRSTFVRGYEMMLDSHLMLELMGNKPLTYRLLEEMGAPLPDHARFTLDRLDPALELLHRHGRIVVKPGGGTGGGRGVTTGIVDRPGLLRAAKLAARSGRTLLAEQQVEGSSWRLLYLDGVLLDAVRRDPPIVIGNGIDHIAALVRQENRRREAASPVIALSPLVIDAEMRNTLAQAGRSLSSVPAAGETVTVKLAANENDRRGNVRMTERVSPQIAAAGAQIVRRLGVRLAGLDLHCRDIAGPFDRANCLVGEVNTTPGLHHHMLVSNPGDGASVGQTILEHLFHHGHGTMELPAIQGKRAQEAARVPPIAPALEEADACI